MIDYEKITLSQILQLFRSLANTTIRDKDHLKQKFEWTSTRFDSTVSFFESLGYLRADQEYWSASQRCIDLQRDDRTESEIRECVAEDLFRPSRAKRLGVVEYFSTFYRTDVGIESWPNSTQRIAFSGLRNLMLELDVIRTEHDGIYTVTEAHEYLVQGLSEQETTPSDLAKHLDARKQIGEAAEVETLEYEKRRLSSAPWLGNAIQHVATQNVSAGFDILSYELTERSAPRVPRYIEVKAVSNSEPKFYLTRNELEVAKKFNIRYHLYLIPYTGQGQFEVEALEIIQDPANQLLDSKDWDHAVEVLSFSRARGR